SNTRFNKTRVTATTSRIARRSPPPSTGKKRRVNWPYALLSIIIGTLLWFGVDFKRMKDVVLDVEVEYNSLLPADWKFSATPQRTVRVSLRGPNQEISNLRREEIRVEPEYPKAALEGDTYDGGLTLMPAFVRDLPSGVDVVGITPQIIPVRLSRIITRYLTVEAGEITGTPQEGYAVGRVHQIDPPAMPIAASREFLSKLTTTDVIRTQPFNVEGGRGLVGGMVGLEPFEKDGEIVTVPGMVYMSVELTEVPAEREFEQPFEVRALIDSPFDRYGKLTLSPPSVRVTAAGPKSVIDKLNASEIAIYADMRDRVPAAPGEYNLKTKAITPSRVRVIRIEPDTVKWIANEDAVPGGE
ncbi:MAG: hypothetical protein LUC93_05790, partial [Planctomycetaceae bacterium]|nr:hypothetical protein [Planctomycetaceae bacterium]